MSEKREAVGFFTLPAPLWEQIRVTAGAFGVLVLVGFVVGLVRPAAVEPLLNLFSDMIELRGMEQLAGMELAESIFSNNLFALFWAIMLGFLPFLRLPALELGLNALLLGGFAAYYRHGGGSLVFYLAGVLPHGVTELSALVVSCASGLWLCRTVTDRILGREDTPTIRETFGGCMRAYVRYIAPLLLISALIETFVTPAILSQF